MRKPKQEIWIIQKFHEISIDSLIKEIQLQIILNKYKYFK